MEALDRGCLVYKFGFRVTKFTSFVVDSHFVEVLVSFLKCDRIKFYQNCRFANKIFWKLDSLQSLVCMEQFSQVISIVLHVFVSFRSNSIWKRSFRSDGQEARWKYWASATAAGSGAVPESGEMERNGVQRQRVAIYGRHNSYIWFGIDCRRYEIMIPIVTQFQTYLQARIGT